MNSTVDSEKSTNSEDLNKLSHFMIKKSHFRPQKKTVISLGFVPTELQMYQHWNDGPIAKTS